MKEIMVDLEVCREGVELPVYAHEGDSGMDVTAQYIQKYYRADLYLKDNKIQHSERKYNDEELEITNKAFGISSISLYPNHRCLIMTGIKVNHIPEGYEIQIRPKSGNSLKLGLEVVNSPGTIDSNYRGEIGVISKNGGGNSIFITKGMKIAQLVLCPVSKMKFGKTSTTDNSTRGEGGFGSTGTH